MSNSISNAPSYDSATSVSSSIISASVSKQDDDSSVGGESVDMDQPMALRNRRYNKDIKYHKKKNSGTIPIFTQTQINEMRRVLIKKDLQLLSHRELHPIWVRMGMKGTYPKTESRLVIAAKMKQFAVLNLDAVAYTNDFANAWVSSS